MDVEKIIKEYLQAECGLNERRVLQEYASLHENPEIEKEFAETINNGWKENLIEIQGFTAKRLLENYPLSLLGAYNYLTFLKKEPDRAKALLKKGLPRR